MKGTLCGKIYTRLSGYGLHWRLQVKRASKALCKICEKSTSSYTGYCTNHVERFYSYEYRIRHKNGLINLTYPSA
ncbi:hypothetical protein Glove_131g54 [Diversispora epigaea]|uniref:Uncharacterized protein n=1 Tax=Diversispora epigaea TaxID=1348612 RepID=A0A397J0I7_9GLOM|nr:hypothetical protein Glove_131g54 [Diversispora epigaea]